MSWEAVNWVFEHSEAKGNRRLLLVAIADMTNDVHGYAYPSVETLARRLRVSTRWITKLVKELEAAGELSVERGTGPHGTNRYRIPYPNPKASKSGLSAIPRPVDKSGSTLNGHALTSERPCPQGVMPPSPESVFNPKESNSALDASRSPAEGPPAKVSSDFQLSPEVRERLAAARAKVVCRTGID